MQASTKLQRNNWSYKTNYHIDTARGYIVT
jgi:hypothetical protein